jgi:hypothetical protein
MPGAILARGPKILRRARPAEGLFAPALVSSGSLEYAVMINSSRLLSVCTLLGIAAVAGCEQSAPVSAAASALELANTRCPVMGNEIKADELAPELIREWNGKRVGFCCPPCLEEWAEMTDAQRAEKLANPPAPAAH